MMYGSGFSKYQLLTLISGLGGAFFLFFSWLLWTGLSELRIRASKIPGLSLRRGSLRPEEWSRANGEFLSWPIVRIILILSIVEPLLLAIVLRKIRFLFQIIALSLLGNLAILALAYAILIWLVYRYGRFNLERLEVKEVVIKKLVFWMLSGSLWIPLAVSFFILKR